MGRVSRLGARGVFIKMPKFSVQVAMLVRETRTVIVDAPSFEVLESRLDDVYELACELDEWVSDVEWGCDEGTHTIIGESDGDAEITLR